MKRIKAVLERFGGFGIPLLIISAIWSIDKGSILVTPGALLALPVGIVAAIAYFCGFSDGAVLSSRKVNLLGAWISLGAFVGIAIRHIRGL